MHVIAPSKRTSRAGSRRAASHAGADSPRTIDAVLAVLAPTQHDAATLTMRQ
jgi:hypothetical protein